MEAFEAYGKFLALKRHFTSDSYDYFRYNGKVRTNYEKFLQRKDKYHFHRLGKHEDLENFILSNMIVNDDIWVTDLNDSKAEDNYKTWRKRTGSLSYNFKNEMARLSGRDFDSLLAVTDGQHPAMLQEYMRGNVSLESLMILNDLTSVFKYWNKNISDEIIWPTLYRRMKKYRTFLGLDAKKADYREMLLSTFRKEKSSESIDF